MGTKTIQEAQATVDTLEKETSTAYRAMVAYGERPEVEEVLRIVAGLRRDWLAAEAKLKRVRDYLARKTAQARTDPIDAATGEGRR